VEGAKKSETQVAKEKRRGGEETPRRTRRVKTGEMLMMLLLHPRFLPYSLDVCEPEWGRHYTVRVDERELIKYFPSFSARDSVL